MQKMRTCRVFHKQPLNVDVFIYVRDGDKNNIHLSSRQHLLNVTLANTSLVKKFMVERDI
jgi:hypothetical protein